MTAIEIRTADVQDIGAIMDIMRSAFDPAYGEAWNAMQVEGVLSMTGAHLWIATCAENPVGFALCRAVIDEAELLLIGVKREAQQAGVGRALIKVATENLSNTGVTSIHLEVRDGNPATSLYRNVGFVQIGIRPRYYRSPTGLFFDAATYELKLSHF
jgi:[ribosomal protein S18]-alanine N-acetyltransferase